MLRESLYASFHSSIVSLYIAGLIQVNIFGLIPFTHLSFDGVSPALICTFVSLPVKTTRP
jgi:hypothetical protein